MASEKLRPGPKGFEGDPKSACVLVYPNGTGVPTFKSSKDCVASVARGATGVFNITLQDEYYRIAHVSALYCSTADNEDIYAQGGTMANLGTGTAAVITVKLKTAANNVDVTADAAKFISVGIIFEDSDTLLHTG